MTCHLCSFEVLYYKIMQEVQRNWADISGDLRRCLDACKLGYKELSAASGVSYDAARRYLLKERIKNRTSSAEALCRFFQVALVKSANLQSDPMARMTSALRDIWDGSEPHADLIVELIKTTRSYKIAKAER